MVRRARLHGALEKRPEASSSQGKRGNRGPEQRRAQQPGKEGGRFILGALWGEGSQRPGEWEAPGDVSARGWVVTALGAVESSDKS